MARSWARDAMPLQVQSYNLAAVKSEDGKAGAWIVTWVSPSLQKSRQYTWSAVEAEGNLHKGVFAGLEQSWSGPSGQSMPFEVPAIRIDSDEAFKLAKEEKPAVTLAKKKPDLPIVFLMEKTRQYPDVTWRVMWGESVGTAELSVFVDASTGKILGRS